MTAFEKTEGEKLFDAIAYQQGELDEAEKTEGRNLVSNSITLRKILAHVLKASDERFKQVGTGNLSDALSLAKLQGLQGEARGLAQAVGIITDLLTEKETKHG